MIRVPHYGVHVAEGNIAFLLQSDDSVQNALNLNLTSPFKVKVEKRADSCPHQITLPSSQPDLPSPKVLGDPLFQLMLPVPRRRHQARYLVQRPDTLELLRELTKLSSPARPLISPIWGVTAAKVRMELSITNVSPWVVTGVTSKDFKMLRILLEHSVLSPRQLILAGSRDLILDQRLVTQVPTNLTTSKLPSNLPEVGAWMLARNMRGQT